MKIIKKLQDSIFSNIFLDSLDSGGPPLEPASNAFFLNTLNVCSKDSERFDKTVKKIWKTLKKLWKPWKNSKNFL